MAHRLKHKVALIMGVGAHDAVPGHGRASALLFSREGARIFAADPDAQVAAECAGMVRAGGGEAVAWGADPSDPVQLVSMIGGCQQIYGRIDLLVFDASVSLGKAPLQDRQQPQVQPQRPAADDDPMQAALDDLTAWSRSIGRPAAEAEERSRHGHPGHDRHDRHHHHHRHHHHQPPPPDTGASDSAMHDLRLLLGEALPVMARQGRGAALVLSAVGGIGWRHGWPEVQRVPADRDLDRLLRDTARHWSRSGIRANGVLPGLSVMPPIVEMMPGAWDIGGVPHGDREAHRHVPCGRWNEPWDIAFAALFLGSDEARHITAQTLVVDAGLHMAWE